jgi:protocatechuate 3,4-dioxygenase, beta subunit
MTEGMREMTTIYPAESLKVHPPYDFPAYASTRKRAPKKPLVLLPQTLTELTGPIYGHGTARPEEADLTRQHAGEPLGERVTISGRVLDEVGRPVGDTLIEIWQANSAGRYIHRNDHHPAPIDPNFSGAGRTVTDARGRYKFTTIRPAPYPWHNHPNAWRPAHIHFSLFGPTFLTRLVTQMYFPNDPLFPYDPILHSIPDPAARDRLISRFSLEETVPEWSLGYVFDIVLRGKHATPMEA